MKKIYLPLLLSINSLFAIDLDSYFNDDSDITKDIIEERNMLKSKIENIQKEKQISDENYNSIKKLADEANVPHIYFKQPKIYTIYTREELRSWGDIDVIFNAGWKSVIVGKHRLILNNELKIK